MKHGTKTPNRSRRAHPLRAIGSAVAKRRQRRAMQRALAGLNAHHLRDIGIEDTRWREGRIEPMAPQRGLRFDGGWPI